MKALKNVKILFIFVMLIRLKQNTYSETEQDIYRLNNIVVILLSILIKKRMSSQLVTCRHKFEALVFK
jgi:hypothetical protein